MNANADAIRNMMRAGTAGLEPSASCAAEINNRIDMLRERGGNADVKYRKHTGFSRMKRIVAIAAVFTLLCTGTVLAGGHITNLITSSHSGYDYTTYKSLESGMNKNNIDASLPENFSNGYSFEGAVLTDVKAETDDGSVMKQSKGISADYTGKEGDINLSVSLASVNEDQQGDSAVTPTEQITADDGTVLSYNSDTYLNVPDGYSLSAEEQARAAANPHFYVSYGGTDYAESSVQDSVSWQSGGYSYILSMNHSGSSRDTLVSMAEEMTAK